MIDQLGSSSGPFLWPLHGHVECHNNLYAGISDQREGNHLLSRRFRKHQVGLACPIQARHTTSNQIFTSSLNHTPSPVHLQVLDCHPQFLLQTTEDIHYITSFPMSLTDARQSTDWIQVLSEHVLLTHLPSAAPKLERKARGSLHMGPIRTHSRRRRQLQKLSCPLSIYLGVLNIRVRLPFQVISYTHDSTVQGYQCGLRGPPMTTLAVGLRCNMC